MLNLSTNSGKKNAMTIGLVILLLILLWKMFMKKSKYGERESKYDMYKMPIKM